ncbi:MAG: RHS repeat-associated core domain-containing protein [Myxococcota bacterium]
MMVRFPGTDTVLRLFYKNERFWQYRNNPYFSDVELMNSDCALDRIDIESRDRNAETLVTYKYTGQHREGTLFASAVLSQVGFAPGTGTNEWAKFQTTPPSRGYSDVSSGRVVVVPFAYEFPNAVGAQEIAQTHEWTEAGLAWGQYFTWDSSGGTTNLVEVKAGSGCSNCCSSATFGRVAQTAPYAPNVLGRSILSSFYWAADGGLGWGLNGPLPASTVEACLDGTPNAPDYICASGSTQFVYGQVQTDTDAAELNQCGQPSQPVALLAERGKNGAFSQYSMRFLASVAGGSFEQQRVVSGASNVSSSDGLEETSTTYDYTDSDQQVVSRIDVPSALVYGSEASTRVVRGASGVERAVIRGGRTMVDGQVEEREQGVVMLRKEDGRRPCSNLEEPSESIHTVLGPCSVAGDECQSFSVRVAGAVVNQAVPITEFYYYGDGEVPLALQPHLGSKTSFNSGRLFAVRHFPNGCSSSPIDTIFANYSPTGVPQLVRSADGRTVESEVRGGLLMGLRLSSGAKLEFEWDRGRLMRTTRPEGDSTVICTQPSDMAEFDPKCHRDGPLPPWVITGTAAGKARGYLFDKPSWVADVGRPPILRTVRFQRLEYVGGSLSAQALLGRWVYSSTSHQETDGASCAFEPCFSRTDYELDADLRISASRVGTKGADTDWTSTLRRDSMSNVIAAGAGVNLPSTILGGGKPKAFCLGNEANCVWYGRDRLDRLTSAYWPRDGVSSCIAYDRRGNVSVVAQGCLGDPQVVCASGFDWTIVDGESVVGGPSCGHRQEYIWDDFDRVVAVRDAETGAVTRYSYFPNGDLLSEQSQEQRSQGEASLVLRDALGRMTGMTLARSGGQTQMLSRVWDSAPAVPQGCEPSFVAPVLSSLMGHVAYTEDPVWNTWYAYDLDGRLRGEHRIAAGQESQCATKPEAVSNTTEYQYTPNGNLQSIRHPFGRVVQYHYPMSGDYDNNLPERVSVELFGNGRSMFATVADGIRWTPDRRLASFVSVNYAGLGEGDTTPIETYRTLTTLDYGIESTVRPKSCGQDLSFASRDFTGRLRRIRVEEIKPSGLTGAVLYERYYTWAADQIVAIDLCYEGQSQPLPEFAAPLEERAWPFDQQNRLLVNQIQDYSSLPNSRSRTYSYDSLGNRWAEFLDSTTGVGWNYTYGSSSMLTSVGPTGVTAPAGDFRGYRDFEYDDDGRQVRSLGAWTTAGHRNSSISFAFPSGAKISGGSRSVVRGVEVSGTGSPLFMPLAYNYYYDGDNKRTRKEYPNGATEDFFYDQSKRLIVERSFVGLHEDDGVVLDEYVYLGGVPIFTVRSLVDSGHRKPDFSGGCARRNLDGYCGLTQIVSDELGRPLMALDQGMRVVGVGEYDAFGYRNRVRVPGQETNHPADPVEVELASKLGRAQAGVLDSALRARVSFFDAPIKFGPAPRVELREYGSGTVLSSASGALPMMVTPFHRGAAFSVVYVPDGAQGDGAVLDGFDYDRLSSGATIQYFPPLRFPGQYYDEESDLHENWNRYFDPATGRYLSPEPLLQSPTYVRRMAQRGMSVPTYAYAANNPLRYVDSTGLAPGDWFSTPEAAARDAFAWIDQYQFVLSSMGEVGTNIYPIPSGLGPLEPDRQGYTYDPPVPLGSRSGGYLPASANACADAHNHPSGGFPSASDLRGFLGRAQRNGLPYIGFVSNNRWGFFNAPVARVPLVPADQIPTDRLREYFSPQVDGQPIGGGLQWW